MRSSLVLAVWMFVTPTAALAQTAPAASSSAHEEVRISTRRAEPENALSVDLGALLDGSVAVLYERAITPSFSIFGGPRVRLASWGYWLGDSGYASEWVADASFGVEFGAKVYMRGFAPHGAYVSPRVSLHWQSWSLPWTGSRDGTHSVVAVEFGYQWVIARVVTVALGAGVGLTLREAANIDAINFVCPLRVSVGWAF